MGFGNNIYSTGASGPDIEYTHRVILVWLPGAGKVIAMKESRATAWGPSPTPVITLVSPSSWNAGTNTSFTINGSGFGTAPTLSIVGNGITSYNIVGSPSDRMISASVTIDASTPDETVMITVVSNGYDIH